MHSPYATYTLGERWMSWSASRRPHALCCPNLACGKRHERRLVVECIARENPDVLGRITALGERPRAKDPGR